MKTILLPTDFSKEAEKGYTTAVSIAKTLGVGIHVFNIVKSHSRELNFGYAGYDTFDKLSKMAHFVPVKKKGLTAVGLAQHFFDHVFRLHGLPLIVVSDRDERFNNVF